MSLIPNLRETFASLDPYNLILLPQYSFPCAFPGQHIIDALNNPLTNLSNYATFFEINGSLFTAENLRKHEHVKIDVVVQPRKFIGFDMEKNRQKRVEMTIGDYLDYIDSHSEAHEVKYGVNIDLKNELSYLNDELSAKVHPRIRYMSRYDLLSYLTRHIDGMTIPQLYVKEKDVFTGAHEENNRFHSVNINHGPGDSEWYGVPLEDMAKARECIMRDYGVDIYLNESLLFPDELYFLKNNLRIIKGLQKAGDVMVVGTGCLHWFFFN